MAVKFMNNSIKVGKGKSFADLVREKVEKQASSDQVVKTAEAEEADSSGQLEVEPLHQEGESEEPSEVTDENKKTKAGKKEAGKKEKGDHDYDSDESEENKDEKGGSDVDNEELEDAGEKGGEESDEKDCRVASSKPRFQKVAKLNEESKALLRAEWESVFPKDYVDAMLAEY